MHIVPSPIYAGFNPSPDIALHASGVVTEQTLPPPKSKQQAPVTRAVVVVVLEVVDPPLDVVVVDDVVLLPLPHGSGEHVVPSP